MRQEIVNVDEHYQPKSRWLHEGRASLLKHLLQKYTVEGPLLDVGTGLGQHLKILSSVGPVDAVEISSEAVKALERNNDIRRIYTVGIPDLQTEEKYQVICSMDSLECIADDKQALQWISKHLLPSGHLILFVPANPWFYSSHDAITGNLRRYSLKTLSILLQENYEICFHSHFVFMLFPMAILSRYLWACKKKLGFSTSIKKQNHQFPRISRKPSKSLRILVCMGFLCSTTSVRVLGMFRDKFVGS